MKKPYDPFRDDIRIEFDELLYLIKPAHPDHDVCEVWLASNPGPEPFQPSKERAILVAVGDVERGLRDLIFAAQKMLDELKSRKTREKDCESCKRDPAGQCLPCASDPLGGFGRRN